MEIIKVIDKHTLIKWQCALCKDILTSDSREHHTLDKCKCGKTMMDHEYYTTRMIGNTKPKIIEEIDL